MSNPVTPVTPPFSDKVRTDDLSNSVSTRASTRVSTTSSTRSYSERHSSIVSTPNSINLSTCEDDLEKSTTQIERGLESLMLVHNEIKRLQEVIQVKDAEVRSVMIEYDYLRVDLTEAQVTLADERSKRSSAIEELRKEQELLGKLTEENRVITSQKACLEAQVTDIGKTATLELEEANAQTELLRRQMDQMTTANNQAIVSLQESLNTKLKHLASEIESIRQQNTINEENAKKGSKEFEKTLDKFRAMNCQVLNEAIDKAQNECAGDLAMFAEKVNGFVEEARAADINSDIQSRLEQVDEQLMKWVSVKRSGLQQKEKYEAQIMEYAGEIKSYSQRLSALEIANAQMKESEKQIARENDAITKLIEARTEALTGTELEYHRKADDLTALHAKHDQAKVHIATQDDLLKGAMVKLTNTQNKLQMALQSKLAKTEQVEKDNAQLMKASISSQAEIQRLTSICNATKDKASKLQATLTTLSKSAASAAPWMEEVSECIKVITANKQVINKSDVKLFLTDHHAPIVEVTDAYLNKVYPRGVQNDLDLINNAGNQERLVEMNTHIAETRNKDIKNYNTQISVLEHAHLDTVNKLRQSFEQMLDNEIKKQTKTMVSCLKKKDDEIQQAQNSMKELEKKAMLDTQKLNDQLTQLKATSSATNTKLDLYAKQIASMKQPAKLELPDLTVQMNESRAMALQAKAGLKEMSTRHHKQLMQLERQHADAIAALQSDCQAATDRVITVLNNTFLLQMEKVTAKEESINSSLTSLANALETISTYQSKVAKKDSTLAIDALGHLSEVEKLKSALGTAQAELERRQPLEQTPSDLTELKSIIANYFETMKAARTRIDDGIESMNGIANQHNTHLEAELATARTAMENSNSIKKANQVLQLQIKGLKGSLASANALANDVRHRDADYEALKSEASALRRLLDERDVSGDESDEIVLRVEDLLSALIQLLQNGKKQRDELTFKFQDIANGLKALSESSVRQVSGIVVADYITKEVEAKDQELLHIQDRVKQLESDRNGDVVDRSLLDLLKCKLELADAEVDRKTKLINAHQDAHKNSTSLLQLRYDSLSDKYEAATLELVQARDKMAAIDNLMDEGLSHNDRDIDERINQLRSVYEESILLQQNNNEAELQKLQAEYDEHMAMMKQDNEALADTLDKLQACLQRQKQTIVRSNEELASISDENNTAVGIFEMLRSSKSSSRPTSMLTSLYDLAVNVVYRATESRKRSITEVYSQMGDTLSTDSVKTPPNPMKRKKVATLTRKNAITDIPDSKSKVGSNAFANWTASVSSDGDKNASDESKRGLISAIRGRLFA